MLVGDLVKYRAPLKGPIKGGYKVGVGMIGDLLDVWGTLQAGLGMGLMGLAMACYVGY